MNTMRTYFFGLSLAVALFLAVPTVTLAADQSANDVVLKLQAMIAQLSEQIAALSQKSDLSKVSMQSPAPEINNFVALMPILKSHLPQVAGANTGGPYTRSEVSQDIIDRFGLTTAVPTVPTFADVPATHPHFAAVETMNELGISSGCATGPRRFCPDALVTRGLFAIFTLQASETPVVSTSVQTFADVPTTHAFHQYVEAAHTIGYMADLYDNVGDHLIFSPFQLISPTEAETALLNITGSQGTDGNSTDSGSGTDTNNDSGTTTVFTGNPQIVTFKLDVTPTDPLNYGVIGWTARGMATPPARPCVLSNLSAPDSVEHVFAYGRRLVPYSDPRTIILRCQTGSTSDERSVSI